LHRRRSRWRRDGTSTAGSKDKERQEDGDEDEILE